MEAETPFDGVTFEEVADDPESPPTDEQEEDEQNQPTDEQSDTDEQEVRKQEEEESEEGEKSQSEEEESQEEEGEDQKDETEKEEEESVSVIEALKSQTGIDTGEEYEDNLEGAAQYINDAVQEQTQEQINQTFESLPEDVQTYMQFRANGGDPEEFMQVFNSSWNDTELREDDSDQHESIVRNRLREEGWDQEEIDEAVEDYKTSGVLYNEAKRSLNRLQQIEEQRQENLVEEQEQQMEQQQEQIEEAWNEIENTLQEKSELNGLPVPESKKDDFFNWMNEPVEEVNGQPVSRRDMAAQNADLETMLTLDYVLYLMNDDDLSFSEVINNKAKTKKAQDLESLLSSSQDEDKPSDKSQGPSGGSSGDEIDAGQLPDATELIG